MSELVINNVTNVFRKNYNAFNEVNEQGKKKYRFIVNSGGTRSSKTYSILQLLILLASSDKLNIDIVRQSNTTLANTIVKDLLEILQYWGLYSEKNHNIKSQFYQFPNGSIIRWVSASDSTKLKGTKRDILFIDEADELELEQFTQLRIRTTGTIFLSYNPSDPDNWVEKVKADENAIHIHSTYKDNRFLPIEQVKDIESLIHTDYNTYLIYTLGQPPIRKSQVYSHFKVVDVKTFNPKKYNTTLYDTWFAIDFGFKDVTALVQIFKHKTKNFVIAHELIYQDELTSSDIVNRFNKLNISKEHPIYYDVARPEIAEDLKRAGYTMKPANKRIDEGIDCVKATKVYYTNTSENFIKEKQKYSYKTNRDGSVTNELIDKNNHLMDALRYAIYTHLKSKSVNATYINWLLKKR